MPQQAPVDLADWQNVTAKPEDEIVIVSIGEVGPWGCGSHPLARRSSVSTPTAASSSPAAGGARARVDDTGLVDLVRTRPMGGLVRHRRATSCPKTDIAERYHDEVVARSGIRPFDEGMGNDYKDGADEEETEVFLDHDVTFSVPTEDIAKEYVKMDEAHTSIAADPESGEWNVTRHAGSMIRVPRRATMTRTVGGQFPKGFDPLKWGIPASMVGDVDKIALWNIVTTVDAYLSAGFTPTEVLQRHPSLDGGGHAGNRLRRHDVDAQAVP